VGVTLHDGRITLARANGACVPMVPACHQHLVTLLDETTELVKLNWERELSGGVCPTKSGRGCPVRQKSGGEGPAEYSGWLMNWIRSWFRITE
jgi:hypothetical protein